ncbi:hypothetical protein GIB67_001541 [Kingdonia uniflora]|uniref:Rx N-terminal domain-containing protein n=1 Tax=Kingdonia uniflora TaxID=39325 RepID=A0A7J7NQE9_9MAGN|nr:hypothetical protein GIB67_001541 [Kingdonia uniflora]
MADALISVVVEQLAPFLLDKLRKEVKLVLGAPEDVQELHDTFGKIRDVLDDAEKRHVKNVLHNLEKNEIQKVPESAWLEKLKDVSYEMEDVLDEWRTKILNSEIAVDESSGPDGIGGARTSKKKVWSCFLSPGSCFNKATLHHNIGRRILELKGRLDLLITEKEKYKFEVTKNDNEQQLRRLPNGIGNLVNLRQLEFEGCSRLECFPRGIGKLKDLETLTKFVVSGEGSDIGELKDLNNLRDLTLIFNDDDDDEAVKSAFELLEPHSNLEKLEIDYYNGFKFPSWMEFPNWEGRSIMLRRLTIRSCKNLKVLPALARLEFLECLELAWLDSVSPIMDLEVFGVLNGDSVNISAPIIAFPNLKKLSISYIKHWEEWVITTATNITVMPLLQDLSISHCPMLKSLPCQILSNSLREMTIDSCPHLEFSYLPPFLEMLILDGDAGSLSISLPIQNGLHSNLKSLFIWFLPHSTLSQGLSQLKALQTLKVFYCNLLSSMSEELQHLTSLQRLDIGGCPILEPRCEKEVGEDWSIISHIPNIYINNKKIQ